MARVDTILKLSLAAGALLAGAGVGYYFGVFLPGEAIRQTMAAADGGPTIVADRDAVLERAVKAEEQRKEASRQRYQSCLDGAELTYQGRWTAACRAQHARQQAAYEDCADDWFRSKKGCAREFPIQPEHGCALPTPIGNPIARARDTAKAQCLGEFQSGV